jgi:hypothetical protein
MGTTGCKTHEHRRAETPTFSCGLTVEEHDLLKLDEVRRETELVLIGQQHIDEIGCHLQLANQHCGSTLAWALPGHSEAP